MKSTKSTAPMVKSEDVHHTGALPYRGQCICIYRTRGPALSTVFTSLAEEKKKKEGDGEEGGEDLRGEAAN